MVSAVSVCLAALVAAAPAADGQLAEGIRQYEARDYAAALGALTQALDTAKGARQRAKVHVYIGLIQYAYKQTKDAEKSFEEALELNPRARLPKDAPRGAQKVFARVKPHSERVTARRTDRTGRAAAERAARRSRDGPEDPPPETRDAVASLEAPGSARVEVAPPPPPPPMVAVAPPPPPLTVEGPPPAERGANVPAWVVASVGGAALVTAAVVGGVAVNTQSRGDSEPWANRAHDIYAQANAQRIAAWSTFGVGLAAAGVATWLFLRD